MNATCSRRIGASLIGFWYLSLIVGLVMTLRQPEQLGIPEAYIYWRIVGEGPAWALFLAFGFLHFASTAGTVMILEGNQARWVPRPMSQRIREAGRFMLGMWVSLIAVGFAAGWILHGQAHNARFDVVFRAMAEPPAWIVAVGIVASFWRSE